MVLQYFGVVSATIYDRPWSLITRASQVIDHSCIGMIIAAYPFTPKSCQFRLYPFRYRKSRGCRWEITSFDPFHLILFDTANSACTWNLFWELRFEKDPATIAVTGLCLVKINGIEPLTSWMPSASSGIFIRLIHLFRPTSPVIFKNNL